jgi:integrase
VVVPVRLAQVRVGRVHQFNAACSCTAARSSTRRRHVDALREHRERQLGERLDWGAAYEPHGLVFCREDGTPLWPRTFSRSFDHHVRDAGLPKIRLHDLRHTHATLALEAGIHPKVVQERLGHATIAITLDTYSHAIPAMQEDAAARIAALIGPS